MKFLVYWEWVMSICHRLYWSDEFEGRSYLLQIIFVQHDISTNNFCIIDFCTFASVQKWSDIFQKRHLNKVTSVHVLVEHNRSVIIFFVRTVIYISTNIRGWGMGVCQKCSKFTTDYQTLQEPASNCQTQPKITKVFQSPPIRPSKDCENVPKIAKVGQSLPESPNAYI